MKLNKLPADFEGTQKRRVKFDDEGDKRHYDAANLIRIAKEMSARLGDIVNPVHLIRRKDDDIPALSREIECMRALQCAYFDTEDQELREAIGLSAKPEKKP